MGIFDWLFGESKASEKASSIVKNKRLSGLEKVEKIKDIYTDYFKNKLRKEAVQANLELNYEVFMSEGYQNNVKYESCLNQEKENLAFYNSFTMCTHINKILEQGLDVKLLSASQKEFVSDVLKLKDTCGFDENYDGRQFYNNEDVRKSVMESVNEFIDKNTKTKQEDMELI